MTIPIHRDTDSRVCGAKTTVINQSSVYVNGLLVAVDGDPNTHEGGELIAASKNLYIEGKLVVNHTPDNAKPDGLCPIPPHCNPKTAEGSPDVFVSD